MSEYPNSEFIKVQRKAAQLAEDAYEEDQEWCPTKVSRLLDACNRIESLKQQRDDLLEALKPFGIIAEMIPEPDGSDAEWRKFNTKLNMLSLDYLRAAKTAIAKCKA